jgi:UDP-glucose 4-epimerase
MKKFAGAEIPTAVVTGASGSIGLRLCGRLAREGWRVLAISKRPTPGPWARQICSDLGIVPAEKLVRELGDIKINAIWHLAGRAHARDEVKQDEEVYYRANVVSTKTMLVVAEQTRAKRFVLASSVKAMGEGGWDIQDETAPCCPQSAYGRSKLAAEEMLLHVPPHLCAVALRFCMVYGAGVRGNMPRMVAVCRRRWFPRLPENGNRRSYLHVEDAVEALFLAATHPAASGMYLVTDGELHSTVDLQEAIWSALDIRPPCLRVPAAVLRFAAKTGDVGRVLLRNRVPFDSNVLDKLCGSAAYSSGRLRRELGYHARWPLARGLRELGHASSLVETLNSHTL